MTDEVRSGAQDVARLIASPATRAQVLQALATQPALNDLVAALTVRLVRDIAAGRHPVYATTEDEVTPSEAARLLGVSCPARVRRHQRLVPRAARGPHPLEHRRWAVRTLRV